MTGEHRPTRPRSLAQHLFAIGWSAAALSQVVAGHGRCWSSEVVALSPLVVTDDGVRVTSRLGTRFTDHLPEFRAGIADLPGDTVMDGELVCGLDSRAEPLLAEPRTWRLDVSSRAVITREAQARRLSPW